MSEASGVDSACGSNAGTRYKKDDCLLYSSETLWHSKNKVKGYMYKMTHGFKIFSFKFFYKRYFILDSKSLTIQENSFGKNVKVI